MIKVNYDTKTTLIKGYYPDSINYSSIPEPYIEITEEEHQRAFGKTMRVVKGLFQEYVISDNILLEQAKQSKIAQCKIYLSSTDWQIIRLAEIRLADPTSEEVLKEGVAEKRALARSLQIQIAACKTLKELNTININFE